MVVFLICGFILIALALIGREWLLNQERRRLFELFDHMGRDLADQRVHLDQYAQELHVLRQILLDSGTVSEEDLAAAPANPSARGPGRGQCSPS